MLVEFRNLGVSVSGREYSKAGIRRRRERGLEVIKFNIERDAPPKMRFDLALSMEVTEHLPERASDNYVKLLCQLALPLSCQRRSQDNREPIT